MAIYRRTFSSVTTITGSGYTAFTNPNNAMKTEQSTATYASGTISNSSSGQQIGNRFVFPIDSFKLPSGVSGAIQNIRLVLAKYSANVGNTPFHVFYRPTGSIWTVYSSNTTGTSNQYVDMSIDVPSQYWNSNPGQVVFDVYFTRGGGNGIAVRLPYLYIEIQYEEIVPTTGINIFPNITQVGTNQRTPLTITVQPSNASNKDVLLESESPLTASVEKVSNTLAEVIGRSPGQTRIRAYQTSGGTTINGYCTVNVVAPEIYDSERVFNNTTPLVRLWNLEKSFKALWCLV